MTEPAKTFTLKSAIPTLPRVPPEPPPRPKPSTPAISRPLREPSSQGRFKPLPSIPITVDPRPHSAVLKPEAPVRASGSITDPSHIRVINEQVNPTPSPTANGSAQLFTSPSTDDGQVKQEGYSLSDPTRQADTSTTDHSDSTVNGTEFPALASNSELNSEVDTILLTLDETYSSLPHRSTDDPHHSVILSAATPSAIRMLIRVYIGEVEGSALIDT